VLRALAAVTVVFSFLTTTTLTRAENILFFAAASTADALNEAIKTYPVKTVAVRVSYASTGALARQIENGAPAALFLSASPLWTNRLASKNLLANDGNKPFLGNRLVLAAPKSGRVTIDIKKGFRLAEKLNGGRLAIADPSHAPAGIYAKAALQTLQVWNELARKTARTSDVRSALALIQRAEVPFGIVYRSDVIAVKDVNVIGTFPKSSHPPIIYPLSIVKKFETPAVRMFYDYLRSKKAETIFDKFGFEVSK